MTKKLLTSLLFLCFPLLAFADNSGSLSFAPPPGDFSVVFLGNIFGIVDGVLHGTGSQIMGAMFGVFNSAVLALGGIIIMYTLLISTLNTAHEGEMLGKEWSSIWIPMRSTLGLALLIPKASGYCVMQIFVMWVIVQGVGAADKVWDAALSYLNRGGVIVQAQQNPLAELMGGNKEVAQGAAYILSGQACMAGIQKALENQRESFLALKSGANSGPCAGASAATNPLCTSPVPDFISSVNIVATQNASPTDINWNVSMPNFDSNSPYNALNGVCGTITWAPITVKGGSLGSALANLEGAVKLSASELETADMSRAIALQQMYLDLSTVARVVAGNNPAINPKPTVNGAAPSNNPVFAPFAEQQFGIPYLDVGSPCLSMNNIAHCTGWGSATGGDSSNQSSPLFSGVEFQGAMSDYSGIMMPTLNLIKQLDNKKMAAANRAFIQTAQRQGWMMAGSYFFNLVQLSGSNPVKSDATDTDTGLLGSSFNHLADTFQSGTCASGGYAVLCEWLGDNTTAVNLLTSVRGMIDGSPVVSPNIDPSKIIPTNYTTTTYKALNGPASATVYGFINNSMMLQLPGQPGMKAPQFAMDITIDFDAGAFKLPTQDFGCGNVKTFMFSFCLGGLLGNIFYNIILVNVFNYFLTYVVAIINGIVLIFLMMPLQAIAGLFQVGIKAIQDPTINPVAALATMGINYINLANQMWIYLMGIAMINQMIPWFGLFIMPLLSMVLPLLAAWLGTMTSIGFVTAYYVPVLPYMIFTFGAIAWLMAVIEAMVAAPIVALGVTHPEGHQAFGKGEGAIMILMNVFLRPALMIIGYIAAIILSFVSVWVINAGFANAMSFLGNTVTQEGCSWSWGDAGRGGLGDQDIEKQGCGSSGATSYTNWASVYAFFFSVLIYTSLYLTVVTKAFTLITYLPDKVLRWIGGQPETIGQESTQWAEETKGKVEKAGADTQKASQQGQNEMSGEAMKKMSGGKEGGGASGKGGKEGGGKGDGGGGASKMGAGGPG